jgi:hypothetical protein
MPLHKNTSVADECQRQRYWLPAIEHSTKAYDLDIDDSWQEESVGAVLLLFPRAEVCQPAMYCTIQS